MSMSISAVSRNTTTPYTTDVQTNYQQARADFKALTDALRSNDLSGAQKDFALLEQDAPSLAQALNTSTTTSGSTALDSFKTLASALQSNDLTGAQNALTTLQQSMASQTGVAGHHHHHHHLQSTGAASAASTIATTAAPAASGSVISALA